jgi:membrane-bound metal-dependent hydrolase YbcI (DUF457 family)
MVAVATVLLFAICLWLASRLPLPNPFKWQELTLLSVAAGALAGTYSHIVLDSVMHSDITPLAPLAPFSNANPLLQMVSLSTLHWFCLAAGAAGLCVLGIRHLLRAENAPHVMPAKRAKT